MAATFTPGAGRMAATPAANWVKVKIEKSGKRKLFETTTTIINKKMSYIVV